MRLVIALICLLMIVAVGVGLESLGHPLARWFGGDPLLWSMAIAIGTGAFITVRALLALRKLDREWSTRKMFEERPIQISQSVQ